MLAAGVAARSMRFMVSQAVVIATGFAADGRRDVLSLAVGDWRARRLPPAFLRSPKSRALTGMQLVISTNNWWA